MSLQQFSWTEISFEVLCNRNVEIYSVIFYFYRSLYFFSSLGTSRISTHNCSDGCSPSWMCSCLLYNFTIKTKLSVPTSFG